MRKIVLASNSPRRKELLEKAGIEFEVMPSKCAEKADEEKSVEDIVKELSRKKAEDVYSRLLMDYEYQPDAKEGDNDFIVIGADTLVYCNDRILGKPGNEDDATRMIGMIQNNTHKVYTGVTLINSLSNGAKGIRTFVEVSEVEVFPMSVDEIFEYIDTGEPMDKAGAYAIQGVFTKFIKRINGDYNNIVGLPLGRVYSELKKLWD
ncbi:MAG: septum formation protein Maf [Lachnospiraceae bacterium]|nr:septum formation protein Maf [Lachnospiraceae bacterium]